MASSPAASIAAEDAVEVSNHGSSTRSSRARSGSTHPGPTAAVPQSTTTISPPGRRSRLSLRMSQWQSWPPGSSANAVRVSAQRAASARTQSGTEALAGAVSRVSRVSAQIRNRVLTLTSGTGADQVPGSGSTSRRTAESRSVVASTAWRSASSWKSGCVPSTSSRTKATQSPSSRDATRSAHSSWEPISSSTATSRRNRSGVSGLRSAPTALTKARVPSAHTTRVAQPGDMPPTCSCASVTGEPSVASTQARTSSGTPAYGVRTPAARGRLTTSPAARPATPSTPRHATAGGHAGAGRWVAPAGWPGRRSSRRGARG